jgi:hypothetical protein
MSRVSSMKCWQRRTRSSFSSHTHVVYSTFARNVSSRLGERSCSSSCIVNNLDSNQRLVRLRQWLSPLSKIKSFDDSQDTADSLISEFKCQLSESNHSGELSPGLVTVLRVIQHLSIAPDSQFVLGAKVELKYDSMLSKLFSQGIHTLLINVLEVSTAVRWHSIVHGDTRLSLSLSLSCLSLSIMCK